MEYRRNLTDAEIAILSQQNCKCNDWSRIKVGNEFNPLAVRDTTLSGEVHLGAFRKSYLLAGGIPFPAGIYNARLHNCSVGDDCLIRNVNGYLANCDIAGDVIIMDVNTILTEGKSHFGNNTEAHVLNETGGREVPIYNELSAQIGYIMAMYRYRKSLIEKMKLLISEYSAELASHRCRIGKGSKIINCGSLRNVNVGEYARLYGVSSLKNGSVNSCSEARTRVGADVVARDFIFSSGAIVSDGAQITRSFVGQASHVGHLFSAHDSLMFSNCQLENGEACAVLAGPYSVSMHKSSLLIAAMYSFLNAGSGFNQSNHMYKLGPIHQGIVERGGRMASDSYILWPAKIGPFSMVMGRHMKHLDTSDLPFSYIIQIGTESYIMPGANLQRVGTVRDSYKWPERDKRSDPHRLDIINFDLLTPYTMNKILRALQLLRDIKANTPGDALKYKFQGGVIKSTSLERGVTLYEMAVRRYLGNTLIKRLTHANYTSVYELREALHRRSSTGLGEWVDMAGFIAPVIEVNDVLERVESGEIKRINAIQEEFRRLQEKYDEMEWNWNSILLERWYNIDPEEISVHEIKAILSYWHEAIIRFDELLLEDAAKEFHQSSRIGYGIDGNEADRLRDFEAVRGSYDDQAFVQQIRKHIETKNKLYRELLQKLDDLPS
ncbi:MAG: DUF4954 family protein [Bacteroidales bacterium]